MTVTLTYDDTLGRVVIDADALTSAVDYATVERSVDQVVWSTVRGCGEVDVTAGEFTLPVYDYEFRPDVVNYYRVRGVDTSAISFVAAGTASTGSSGSRTPGAPAGIVAGDLVLISASTRNSGTGTVNTPTDWTVMGTSGNFTVFGRIYNGVWSMPTITYTSGSANEDTIAQSAAFRNAALDPAVGAATGLNSSAQNVAHPALIVPADDLLIVAAGWKQDDYTSVAALSAPATWSEIQEASSTAGNDASQIWNYLIQTTATNVAGASFVVTGGASAISRAIVMAFERAAYLNQQTASITPEPTSAWLKSIMRAFLNRPVSLGGPPLAPTREGRGTEHDVAGRTLPVAVVEVAGSRIYTLRLRTETDADGQTMDYALASGDVLFLHGPVGSGAPAGGVYFTVKSATETPLRNSSEVRHWLVQARESAAPGPDVVTATATWDSVLALYATWDDLLAAHATWDSLLALVGDPAEVIVA